MVRPACVSRPFIGSREIHSLIDGYALGTGENRLIH